MELPWEIPINCGYQRLIKSLFLIHKRGEHLRTFLYPVALNISPHLLAPRSMPPRVREVFMLSILQHAPHDRYSQEVPLVQWTTMPLQGKFMYLIKKITS